MTTPTIPPVPNAETTATAIEPLRSLMWQALEYGIQVAKLHFGENNLVDGSLGSHIVRYHARQFPRSHDISCEAVPLSGVAFRWAGYYIRVLKADEGALPAPGRSERKQHFYCQTQLSLFSVEAGEAELDPEINLVVLWDVTRGSFNNLTLMLACPRAGGITRDSVEAYWYRPLEHPTQDGATQQNLANTEIGSDDLDIHDLPEEGTGSDEDNE